MNKNKREVILKYPVKVHERTLLVLPYGSTILGIKKVNETPCIYARVDSREKENEMWEVCGVQTGESIDDFAKTLEYLDTIVFFDGQYVEHYFISPEGVKMPVNILNLKDKVIAYAEMDI